MHGILFIGFLVALMLARDAMRWSFRWTGLVLLAALLPFGPFVIDGRLRKQEQGSDISVVNASEFNLNDKKRG
jgi:hypothetical protein